MVCSFRDVYVKRVINLEENHDVIKGDRYLIELVSHLEISCDFDERISSVVARF